jgi:hypothetical protein
MPESFKAFCRIVSLTAAKTRRMLVVSVAWVRLMLGQRWQIIKYSDHSLRVEVEVGSIDLVEPPQEIFGSSVYVIAARIIWKVIAERRASKLDFEEVDLVEEQYDTGPHEPSRVDDRIE